MITTNETELKKERKEREVEILSSNEIQPKLPPEPKEIKPAGTPMITTENVEEFQEKLKKKKKKN